MAEPDYGSITGTVFDDMNQNGMMDEGEMGLAGLEVGLVDAEGKSIGATTDADGKYLFNGLPEGKYFVDLDETTLPAGGTGLNQTVGTDPPAVITLTAVLWILSNNPDRVD